MSDHLAGIVVEVHDLIAEIDRLRAHAPTSGQLVRAFHDAFGVPTPDRPGFPARERRMLRWRLDAEELKEASVADDANDLVACAEEWADQVIVKLGQALEHGIDLEPIIAAKMRANMSKLGPDGMPVLRADGKVLKGPDYRPADVAGVLREQGWKP